MSDGHGKTWEMGDLHIEDEKISAAKKGIFERASNDSLRRDKNQLFLYFSVDICSLLYFSRFIRFIVCPSDCMDIESLVCQNSFKF